MKLVSNWVFSQGLLLLYGGVESNFGRLTGNYNVIEALSTLAYEGRREAFFRNQVMAALEILNAGHITPKQDERFLGRSDGAASVYADLILSLCYRR